LQIVSIILAFSPLAALVVASGAFHPLCLGMVVACPAVHKVDTLKWGVASFLLMNPIGESGDHRWDGTTSFHP
jgi:hypothetical protein